MSEPRTEAKLWVYGSLLEGFFNYERALTDQIRSRTPAHVKGQLYHQSNKGYPAMVQGTDWVYGELLTIRDFASNIDILDAIENYYGPGADNEYNRILTPVYLNVSSEHIAKGTLQDTGSTSEQAYVYWYGRNDLASTANPSVYLPCGEWRSYMREKIIH